MDTVTPRSWPRPVMVRNAVIGPLLMGSGKGKSVFQADTPGVVLDQWHDPAGFEPFNGFTVRRPPWLARMQTVEEPCLYAGPVSDHFGHMIAENLHRLWARAAFPELAEAKVAFQVCTCFPGPAPWFEDLMLLCGVRLDQVLFVNRLTRFRELHVPARGRTMQGTTLIEGYEELFPLAPLRPLTDAPKRIYVSRRQHAYTGSYLGERYVERALKAAEFTVVRPEKVAPPVFASMLAAAEMVVFAEGSAIHNLDLCGRVQAKVFVIGRKGGAEKRFGRLLQATTARWAVFDELKHTVSLSWNPTHLAASRSTASGFVDIPRLMEMMGAFLDLEFETPDPEAATAAVALDMLEYMMDERSAGLWTSDEHLGQMLRTMRQSPRVQALMRRVAKIE